MQQKKHRLRPPVVAEIVFDLGYLLFAGWAAFKMLRAEGSPALATYGLMTALLAGGDSFHLIPRVWAHLSGTMERSYRILGFGKAVTSVTMTVFYLLLYRVWVLRFAPENALFLTVAIVSLAVLRIALCFFPQNQWLAQKPSMRWSVYRNLPFAILGGLVAWAYTWPPVSSSPFGMMPLAIFLSFLFYAGVVLFSQRYPKMGVLMLPKTCAYIWIITMGFSLF